MEAHDRSMNAEFRQGSIDNSYIQVAPNVGGLVEMDWRIDRALALPLQYAAAERRMMDPFDFARAHRRRVSRQP